MILQENQGVGGNGGSPYEYYKHYKYYKHDKPEVWAVWQELYMRTRKYPREGSSTRLDSRFWSLLVLILRPDQAWSRGDQSDQGGLWRWRCRGRCRGGDIKSPKAVPIETLFPPPTQFLSRHFFPLPTQFLSRHFSLPWVGRGKKCLDRNCVGGRKSVSIGTVLGGGKSISIETLY